MGNTETMVICKSIYAWGFIVVALTLLAIVIICLTIRHMNLRSQFSEEYAKARKDALTGLKNRLAFEENCAYIEKERLTERYTVLSADLNNLKITNDTKGHAAGDELIKAAAKMLKETFSKYGNVYRTGGDEFVALLACSSTEADEMLDRFKEKLLTWRGKYSDEISVATGTAAGRNYPNVSIYKLIKKADLAMYVNKKGGECNEK